MTAALAPSHHNVPQSIRVCLTLDCEIRSNSKRFLPRGTLSQAMAVCVAAVGALPSTHTAQHGSSGPAHLEDTGHLQHPLVQGGQKTLQGCFGQNTNTGRESCVQTIDKYLWEGWEVIYANGSVEDHREVGRSGGYGVYLGDSRDAAVVRVWKLASNLGPCFLISLFSWGTFFSYWWAGVARTPTRGSWPQIVFKQWPATGDGPFFQQTRVVLKHYNAAGFRTGVHAPQKRVFPATPCQAENG